MLTKKIYSGLKLVMLRVHVEDTKTPSVLESSPKLCSSRFSKAVIQIGAPSQTREHILHPKRQQSNLKNWIPKDSRFWN